MALSRLGNFIEMVDIRNKNGFYKEKDVRGISTTKIFIKTKANLNNVNLLGYKIVQKNCFAYVADTSRRGEKIAIAYSENYSYIISSIYTTFKVKDESKLLPRYLMMFFNRPEFDRYARFNSWGSARETFSWDDFCNIELNIPSIEIQKKYVAIYEAMLDNQKAYKKGLDDLKLVCDGYIEELRKNYKPELIGEYLLENREKNVGADAKILGISKEGFIEPKQKVGNEKNYTLFGFDDFVYSPPRINVGSIGLFKENTKCACSPIYVSFRIIDKDQLCPDYLLLWFKREEFKRYTDFYSIASVRNNFSFDLLREMKLPIPPIEIQKSIVEVLNAFNQRKLFANSLNKQMTDICPVLIRGSLLESLK